MKRQRVLVKAAMTNDIRYLLCLSCIIIEYSQSQFVSLQRTPTNVCDNSGNAVLIEHFFNLIFSEFHDRPPACVCVQMCIEQPTYCYPNGCLKIENKKKPDDYQLLNQVYVQQDNKPMTFLVNEQKDFINHFVEANDVTGKLLRMNEGTVVNAMRPDPFKDRYKSSFTIKKMPKVHLKYNLREQVKNMNMKSGVVKIDKIDVSNTRWPVNKYIRVNDKKQYQSIRKDGSSKFFPGLSLESFPVRYKNNFYKRDLTKNLYNVDEKSDDPDKTIENARFSLDSLIENLIDNSFVPLTNETELDLSLDINYSSGNITTSESIILPYKRSILKADTKIINHETTNVSSINSTNANGVKIKYMDATSAEETYKNVYNEMIEILSKNIEKQNNSSLEMVEQFPEVIIESPTEENSTNSEMIIETTTMKDVTTTKDVTSLETTNPSSSEMRQITSTKKSRQRISRKLHNGKVN